MSMKFLFFFIVFFLNANLINVFIEYHILCLYLGELNNLSHIKIIINSSTEDAECALFDRK